MQSDYKLKITFNNKDPNQITIAGNKKGLEYLANCCLSIIGKEGPGGHFHLNKEDGNLLPGSIPTVLIYSDNNEKPKQPEHWDRTNKKTGKQDWSLDGKTWYPKKVESGKE